MLGRVPMQLSTTLTKMGGDALSNLVPEGRLTLVTGGAGFIGSHLVRRLLRDGARVRVIDDFSTGSRERLYGLWDRVELLERSVADVDSCRLAADGVDTVFHQAALPSVERSVADPLGTHEADATGTLSLLVASRDAGVRRFVFAGSSSAYGDTQVLAKSEDLPAVPRSPYAAAKLCGEQYTRLFSWVYGMETVVLRYFNIFGPGQDPMSQYSAVIPLMVAAALRNESPVIHGDGEQTRDFTHIENVVQANLQAAKVPPDRSAGEIFNVGCGERVSINRLWETIRQITGCSSEAIHVAARPGDVRDSLADISRARDVLGYSVSVHLREGLKRTIEWYRRVGFDGLRDATNEAPPMHPNARADSMTSPEPEG